MANARNFEHHLVVHATLFDEDVYLMMFIWCLFDDDFPDRKKKKKKMYLMDQDEEHYSILHSFQTYLCRTTGSDKFVTSW